MPALVAIVGRPNVGKSTFFNRLLRQRKSVVHDRPGVTRDRIYGLAELLERRVWLIDTGGIEPDTETNLLAAMRVQTEVALEEADVIVLLVDGRAGCTAADLEVIDRLRVTSKPVLVAVNKIDGARHEGLVDEFWQFGVDALFPISAEHGQGVYELCEAIEAALPPENEEDESVDARAAKAAVDPSSLLSEERPMVRIAVLGRPNAGKSTLVNQLLGYQRQVVDNRPGTTLDAVDSELEVDGRRYVLVDTAGVRRKSKIGDPLERFVAIRAIRTVERCHVALLVVDAVEGLAEQEARLARLVIDRGRALILLFNKWDLSKDQEDVSARAMQDERERQLPHMTWAPHLFIAAKTGKGVHRILPMVDRVMESFNQRIPTPELNRFLEAVVSTNTPPQRHHRPVRLYYATQSRVRPPTFTVFSNTPDGVEAAYRRYLVNQLREAYGFEGSPIKLFVRRRRKLGEERE